MNERTHSRNLCVPNSFAFKWTFKKTDREKNYAFTANFLKGK